MMPKSRTRSPQAVLVAALAALHIQVIRYGSCVVCTSVQCALLSHLCTW